MTSLIREAQLAGAGVFIILASAAIGLVWLSVWAVSALSGESNNPALIVGAAALLPLALLVVQRLVRHWRYEQAEAAQVPAAAPQTELSQAVEIAQLMAQRSPLTTLAVAAAAGLLVARYPSLLGSALQALTGRR